MTTAPPPLFPRPRSFPWLLAGALGLLLAAPADAAGERRPQRKKAAARSVATAPAAAFRIGSPDLPATQEIPVAHRFDGFDCGGENRSPRLWWRDPPAGTRSFVLTVYNPDLPTGSGWWHWVVYDIPPATRTLEAGIGRGAALPPGAREARNDGGLPGYLGPCPRLGKGQRTVITVHALKVPSLPVAPDASPALIGYLTRANELGRATLTVRARR